MWATVSVQNGPELLHKTNCQILVACEKHHMLNILNRRALRKKLLEIIMRNKIIFVLLATAYCDFLSSVLPEACP